MSTEERFQQLEDVMAESLRKQDRIIEEVASLREGQSELNTKIIRVENRIERVEKRLERVENKLEDNTRSVLELRRDVEKHQQTTNAGIAQIIDSIHGLK